ncbi:FadR/GntR family transcriptional regulator [Brevibacillus marinus]|uniref:FadR/GntR family transcriptional regulator n=1 Tax=Brevibacillus marinus TaxID=2496837 RepID=UPI000F847B82|nr:FadR/GntR family transcriptional regulator [Brevibacillus marinus]
MFRTVKNKKIFEEILDQIQELLITKQLELGQKIPSEMELSESLGISRSSLREALKVLSVLGIVESKAGDGTVIKQADPDKLKNIISLIAVSYGLDTTELYEVRTILEMKAAGLAAVRRDEEDLKAMKRHLDNMDSEVNNETLTAEADFLFHQAIVASSKNKMLVLLMELISGLLGEMIHNTRRRLGTDIIKRFQEQHRSLFHAIEAGNPKAAQTILFEHLTFAQEELGLLSGEKKAELHSSFSIQ